MEHINIILFGLINFYPVASIDIKLKILNIFESFFDLDFQLYPVLGSLISTILLDLYANDPSLKQAVAQTLAALI